MFFLSLKTMEKYPKVFPKILTLIILMSSARGLQSETTAKPVPTLSDNVTSNSFDLHPVDPNVSRDLSILPDLHSLLQDAANHNAKVLNSTGPELVNTTNGNALNESKSNIPRDIQLVAISLSKINLSDPYAPVQSSENMVSMKSKQVENNTSIAFKQSNNTIAISAITGDVSKTLGNNSQSGSKVANNASQTLASQHDGSQTQTGNMSYISPERSQNTTSISLGILAPEVLQVGDGSSLTAERTGGAGGALDGPPGNSSSLLPSGHVAVVIMEKHIVQLHEATASPAPPTPPAAAGRRFPQKVLQLQPNASLLPAAAAKAVAQQHYWPVYLTLTLLVFSVFCTCLVFCDGSARRSMTAPPKYSPPEPPQYGYPFSYAMRTAEPTAAAAQVP